MKPILHIVAAPLVLCGVALFAVVVAAVSLAAVAMRGLFELGQGAGKWLLNRTG